MEASQKNLKDEREYVKMSNYKGLKFNNTMNDFKRWSKEFPPLEKPAAVKHHKKGDHYLEIQYVKGFLGSDGFVHASVREYDPEQNNFENVPNDQEEYLINTVFKDKVDAFKSKFR